MRKECSLLSEPNELVVAKKPFETISQLNDRLCRAIVSITENGYIPVIRKEDCDIYVIEYAPEDASDGYVYPYWMTEEEYESFLSVQYPVDEKSEED